TRLKDRHEPIKRRGSPWFASARRVLSQKSGCRQSDLRLLRTLARGAHGGGARGRSVLARALLSGRRLELGLGALPRLAIGPAQQGRRATLGKRDLDRVEVARDDRPGKDRPRLVAHLAARVATGEVREREQPDLGAARQLGGLPGGAVVRFARPRLLVVEE